MLILITVFEASTIIGYIFYTFNIHCVSKNVPHSATTNIHKSWQVENRLSQL